jgi:hypothetical protein
MAGGRPKVALILTDDERVHLDSLAHRSRTAPHLARARLFSGLPGPTPVLEIVGRGFIAGGGQE